MSLLFNMLSRLVIAFVPRSKHLLISWLQSPSAVILEPKKMKSVTVSIVSPSICHEVIGPDAKILVFCTSADGGVERCALIFSWENSKITICCWRAIGRRMLDPTKKRIPYIQGQRRSPCTMVGGRKSHLESNLITARDAQRDQTNWQMSKEYKQAFHEGEIYLLLWTWIS